ncbi:MAG: 3-methyl-2-oxobutanoate hydroxymethyltransferase [Opitutaceae bacterium]|nr:3-methyl-2-oxobutanoate hydroxymethyltransferase [Opitutaceae bacterium]
MAKITTHTLRKQKGSRPIVAVTAYDALMARLADDAGVDVILVGDSVGNILLGFNTTVPVTLDMMCHHTAAVSRAKPNALVVADVPFAEAHYEFERVLRACQRLIQESGAEAVKIEGGASLAPMVARLVDAGVPVWAHIGLKPQQVHALGRYRKFGTSPGEAEQLMADAKALADAGAFALLVEMVEPSVARALSETHAIPTIGIGSGGECDGQILVYTDFLGLTPGYVPAFARQFSDAGAAIKQGLAGYVDAVRNRSFP